MGRSEIDEMMKWARQRNIEIDAITISAAAHDALVAELKPAMRHDVNPPHGPLWELRYNGMVIHRRKCVGCCAHA